MRTLYLTITTLLLSFSLKAQTETYIDASRKPHDVQIGTQTWTTTNLDVSRFRNGDTIHQATTIEQWQQAWKEGTPAWCYYENDKVNGAKYGKLYNWYAIIDSRGLAPKGWHIPVIAEWDTLINYLGNDQTFDKMIDWKGWMNGWKKTSNASGFSALGGGVRGFSDFAGVGMITYFWSFPKDVKNYSNVLALGIGIDSYPGMMKVFGKEQSGMYVRCVKDTH